MEPLLPLHSLLLNPLSLSLFPPPHSPRSRLGVLTLHLSDFWNGDEIWRVARCLATAVATATRPRATAFACRGRGGGMKLIKGGIKQVMRKWREDGVKGEQHMTKSPDDLFSFFLLLPECSAPSPGGQDVCRQAVHASGPSHACPFIHPS